MSTLPIFVVVTSSQFGLVFGIVIVRCTEIIRKINGIVPTFSWNEENQNETNLAAFFPILFVTVMEAVKLHGALYGPPLDTELTGG